MNNVINLANERAMRRPVVTNPKMIRALDAVEEGTAALLNACDLLASAGPNNEARECRALAELAADLRSRLPGGLKPAA